MPFFETISKLWPIIPRMACLVSACAMLAACGEEATGPGSSENNPDNVVLIVVSNLSPADIDTPSTDEAPTPNIDVLAAQGVRFLNAYTSSSVSVPARMSLYTGRTPAQLGFEYDMPTTDTIGVDLTRGQTLLPGMLKQSGYVTGFVGAWGLGGVGGQGGDYPGRQGFDEVYAVIPPVAPYGDDAPAEWQFIPTTNFQQPPVRKEESRILTGSAAKPAKNAEYAILGFAQQAVDFIDRHQKETFFLTVSLPGIDEPLQAPKDYWDRFAGIADPNMRMRAAMIAALDDAVGNIVRSLDNRGLAEKTLIVLTSFAGCNAEVGLCQCGTLRSGAVSLYEGGLRVPLIMRYPRRYKPRTQFTPPVVASDLVPTILNDVGAKRPLGTVIDGVALSDYITGAKPGAPHEALAWSRKPASAMRLGDYKVVNDPDKYPSLEIYDLVDDPAEQNNLAEARPELAPELSARLKIETASGTEPRWLSKGQVNLTGCGENLNIYK